MATVLERVNLQFFRVCEIKIFIFKFLVVSTPLCHPILHQNECNFYAISLCSQIRIHFTKKPLANCNSQLAINKSKTRKDWHSFEPGSAKTYIIKQTLYLLCLNSVFAFQFYWNLNVKSGITLISLYIKKWCAFTQLSGLVMKNLL